MPSPSENIVLQYIAAMRAKKATGATTAETSFYTPLDNLFNEVGKTLKPRVVFSTQVSSSASIKQPDGGFFPVLKVSKADGPLIGQRPERGVVEIKPAGDSLPARAKTQQVLDYLRDFGLVLLTNYHQFLLVRFSASGAVETFEPYDLTKSAEDFWNGPIAAIASKHKDTLPDYLARVLRYKVPIDKPKDLAWLLASYAREAKARAHDHPLSSFDTVKSALEQSLGITFEGEKGKNFFISTLIQTLFYGIFSAWILWRRSPAGRQPDAVFNWREAAWYLRIPVLRQLFHTVSSPEGLNATTLTEILDLAGDVLNRVQPAFFANFREEDAVNYFYEPFLEAFDPQLRKELGVWYTPHEIVHYMVERVDHLLRTELNQPDGLASPNVRVLDPCCGTGAYLVAVLQRIHRTLLEKAGDDTAYVPGDLRTAATTRIFGFEIMPAPFVIAHLQVAYMLEDSGAPLADNQRAQIFLTNSLTGWVPEQEPKVSIFPDLQREKEDAEAIKRSPSILVIIGNPPYNAYSGVAAMDEERDLPEEYRYQVAGLPKPEGGSLNDLYVRFFRIAERRILRNQPTLGIISFISNYSWLDGFSHPTMRHRFLTTFNKLFIDNLNGDAKRTGKVTPDGLPDPSAFSTPQNRAGIQVGTAIATFVRNGDNPITIALSNLNIRNLWGTGKLASLADEGLGQKQPQYEPLIPEPKLGIPFARLKYLPEYLEWPLFSELFPVSSPGLTTSRDPVVIDVDRSSLATRMHRYCDADIDNEIIRAEMPTAMAATKRFDPIATRSALIARGFREWQIIPYVYRPFDQRWVYWEPTTKLLDEKRLEYLKGTDYWASAVVLTQQSRKTFDGPMLISSLMDFNTADGAAAAFPEFVISNSMHETSPRIANLTQRAWDLIGASNVTESDLRNHSVAVMHTPAYKADNSGALLRDFPRIPIPSTRDCFRHSAGLGQKLAELLDPRQAYTVPSQLMFLSRLTVGTTETAGLSLL